MSGDLANTDRILIYRSEKGDTKIGVYFEEDIIWMAQHSMAKLCQATPQSIILHIKNVYEDGEPSEMAACKDYLQVQAESSQRVRRGTKFYSLNMIPVADYRVRSGVGIHLRRWASRVLTEYMKKSFILNDNRPREPRGSGMGYFDELLERTRDIRASEKWICQKVKEIFALSVDYDNKSPIAQNFFKSIQNKLEYIATSHTVLEIIAVRADASKDNMGLTAFRGAKAHRGDVTMAKNYMTHGGTSMLNLTVNMYLDYAELWAEGCRPMHMADWENKLGEFLRSSDREVLENSRTVRREVAERLALEQHEQYDAHRRVLEVVDDVDELTMDVKRLKRRRKDGSD